MATERTSRGKCKIRTLGSCLYPLFTICRRLTCLFCHHIVLFRAKLMADRWTATYSQRMCSTRQKKMDSAIHSDYRFVHKKAHAYGRPRKISGRQNSSTSLSALSIYPSGYLWKWKQRENDGRRTYFTACGGIDRQSISIGIIEFCPQLAASSGNQAKLRKQAVSIHQSISIDNIDLLINNKGPRESIRFWGCANIVPSHGILVCILLIFFLIKNVS